MSKLRELRLQRVVDFSQHHMAALTGIPQPRYSLIERGLVTAKPEEKARSPPASDRVYLRPRRQGLTRGNDQKKLVELRLFGRKRRLPKLSNSC